ncbi:competence protein CoiA [Oceanobacillus alkalisoli]|uniref:competence protein CoiA n=1 Tax=Oceanobacillus alkalisoli TaxID=2925113 RepID=UPI001EEFEBD5|nr:competence protein CoiA family protein [Oceanobacillus alkalisoli]MCF3942079.1 competence protein CoiA [Oceanobacillus alkalisoli]MCG5105060.1 competence protein CoiA [Oceanobacillus alkalisoli]
MLQAKSKNGKYITPALLPKNRLLQLKADSESFYCPVCEEKVILRAGEKVVAHFAHTANANCPSSGGGEGAYHEQGKLHLYEWLLGQDLTVELEAHLPEINQRPDLLLYYRKRKIAIEYQCSRISSDEIISRTNGYKRTGIHVVWILGERLLKRKGNKVLKIDSFTRMFIHQFTEAYPLSLFYYCPFTRNLIKFQDFTFTNKNRAMGKLTINRLEALTFPGLLAKEFLPNYQFATIWKKEKNYFRLRGRGRMFGEERNWHRWLYRKDLQFEKLPAIVHLPVSGAYRMKLPGWIWQSWILFEVIAVKPNGSVITTQACNHIVQNYLFPSEYFPLIVTPVQPVREYLRHLCSAGILRHVSADSFHKIAEIHLPDQLETAMIEDGDFITELFQKK